MSRIGRLQIAIPEKVSIEYSNNVVTVNGPLGTLTQAIESKNIDIKNENGFIHVTRSEETKDTKAKHGLYRALIANMVLGVVKPFSRTLLISGVGFKASVNGSKLVMNIGFSHPVEYVAPQGVTLACPDVTTVTVTGISKELVGHTAATIKSKRPVEPYHGYGIRYNDEVVIRKEGKTGK